MKLENEYELVEISDYTIEDIGVQEEWVYDVEVDKTHNFFGNNVLLHNSVYVKAKTDKIFKLMREGKMLTTKLNESYIGFCKDYGSTHSHLEMEFEKIFKTILFVGKKGGKDDEIQGAKKKYAYILLWEDKKTVTNEVKFTGFETRRSDTPTVSKLAQTKIVEMILTGCEKKDIVKELKSVDERIRSGKITTEEIAFPKGISKQLKAYGVKKLDKKTGKWRKTGTPPIITGARYSNNYLGTRFGKGNKPKWIYIKEVPYGYPDTKILAFDGDDVPKGFVVDYDLMIEKILKMKLEEILLASGFGEFPSTDVRQQTL